MSESTLNGPVEFKECAQEQKPPEALLYAARWTVLAVIKDVIELLRLDRAMKRIVAAVNIE